MYRIVFEAQIKGLPSELECLSKLRGNLSDTCRCIGSSANYVCFSKSSLVKVIPKFEEAVRRTGLQPYEVLQQSIPFFLIIEGDSISEISELAEILVGFIRSCGLTVRLIE